MEVRLYINNYYFPISQACILPFFQPEWYFTQVLNWIKNHSDFLQHTIQPILQRTQYGSVDAKVIFHNSSKVCCNAVVKRVEKPGGSSVPVHLWFL